MQPENTDEMAPDAAQMSRAEQAYEEALAVNLDEVTDESVSVTIREYAVDPETMKRKGTWRKTELDAYVPMKIFNAMMAGREKALRSNKIRARAIDQGGDLNDDDPMVLWMLDCVLRVWKLTEPDMTLDRLQEGLDMKKTQALFYRFFGAALSLKKAKAAPAGNTTGDSALLAAPQIA